MRKYRISKYNPQFRNDKGAFEREEWTSYWDIGKKYEERIFTKKDYLNIEKQYCDVILSILKQYHVDKMIICDLELYDTWNEMKKKVLEKGLEMTDMEEKIVKSLKNGKEVFANTLEEYFKLILRECFWCIFVDKKKTVRIEFGYDYYVYVYCKLIDADYIAECKNEGMFIEELTKNEKVMFANGNQETFI